MSVRRLGRVGQGRGGAEEERAGLGALNCGLGVPGFVCVYFASLYWLVFALSNFSEMEGGRGASTMTRVDRMGGQSGEPP